MGLVNAVVPIRARARGGRLVPGDADLSLSLRLLKASFNATEDGLTGIQQLSQTRRSSTT